MANAVCLITNELFPLDKGGIGRLMWNFAINNAKSPSRIDLHFLVHAKLAPQAALVESAFEGLATIHYCRESLEEVGSLGRLIQEIGVDDSLDSHIVESLRYYAGLRRAQRALGREFDIVEFPDFGGWATASIAAKRAGVAFQKTRFSIRLHSTFSRIADHEVFAHEPSDWMAGICDLEYQSLRDADLVVAHLPSIADLNARHFADPAEWRKKVRVEMPPITLAEAEEEALAAYLAQPNRTPPRNFLFSARLQPFKRPDLFVRAAVHFLDEHEDADNLFLISSYGFDENYVDWIERLVPQRWQRNILFLKNISQRERAELILNSILVIPSDFESCCLLAYEGRMLGVKLILNRRCVAFGAEPERWREGVDCLFFEGDFITLASAMEKALGWEPEPAAPLEHPAPYWETPAASLFAPPPERPRPLKLAYLIYGAPDINELMARLQELELKVDSGDIHILAPHDALAAAAVSVSGLQLAGVSVHVTSWLEPTATELQHVVSQLDCDAVAFLPADIRVERHFWLLAAAQLAAQPDAACFTSHTIVDGGESQRSYRLNYGDAPSVALVADRIAHRASVFRRSHILELGLRELAGERWHEDFCVRLVNAGHRVLVAPAGLAIETDGRRYSRISSSRFYASHRDEAGQMHHLLYRQGSTSITPVDSVASVEHKEWVALTKSKRAKLAAKSRSGAEALTFDQVVLKNVTDDGEYRELEIVLRGIAFGRHSLGWLSFKLSEYRGMGQLEFREGGNARQFFKSWPPPTSDEWGAVAVLTGDGKPHPQRVFFDTLVEPDTRRLKLLLDSLGTVVERLPVKDQEAAHWLEVIASLVVQPGKETPAVQVEAAVVEVIDVDASVLH